MKIAVVGGSGFIGSHLVDKLLKAGHDLTILDIMTPYRRDVRHIAIDLLDQQKTLIALAGGYDVIYMLAAIADVNDVYHIPVASTQVNVIGVANILEAARKTGAKRVILASTIWVYSMSGEETVSEETLLLPRNVSHVYTAGKLSAELLCIAYKALYNVNFTILRYGIPYGPGARQGSVVASFVNRALNGQPLVIHGDGCQHRSFIYVEDLAEGNLAALDDKATNQIYNLDGQEKITIREVAETVGKIIGNTTIEFEEGRKGDATGRVVSSLKAKRELGWEPRTPFKEGVRKYVDWYRSFREKPDAVQSQKKDYLKAVAAI